MKQSGPWYSLVSHGYYVFTLLYIYSSGETGHDEIFSFTLNLTSKVRPITPPISRNVDQGIFFFYLWSKFGDPSLSYSVYKIEVTTRSPGHTDRRGHCNDCTRTPKLAAGKNENSALPAFCEGDLVATSGFHSQMASYAEIVSISWRHHERMSYRSMNHSQPPCSGIHTAVRFPSTSSHTCAPIHYKGLRAKCHCLHQNKTDIAQARGNVAALSHTS